MAAHSPETPCVACGAPLPVGSRFCNNCGSPQPAGAAPAPSVAAQPVAAPPIAVQPAAAQPDRRVGAQTVIGIASPVGADVVRRPSTPEPPVPAADAAPKRPFSATMVGIASLPGADRANAPPQAVAPAQPPQPAQAAPPIAATNIPKGTLLGIARPGIAPTHEPKPQAPPQFAPPPPFVAPPPPPERSVSSSEVAGLPKPSRAPAIVLAIVAVIGVLAALLYVFVLRPSGPPALTSTIEGDTNARILVVKCPSCADGSTLDLGGKTATFSGGVANVALTAKDLHAGKNVFRGKVVPKGGKPKDVELAVALPYLVRPSLAPLAKGESKIDVVFELADDVKGVVVGGETIEGHGQKTHALTIPPPAEDARIFDKTVTYEVLPKSGAPIKGSLKVSIPYASLRLGLPGRRPFAIGNQLEVSGKTAASAKVAVGEQTLDADENGIFKGMVTVPAEQTTLLVRAYTAKLAPREVSIPVTHAPSAEAVMKTLRAEAKTPFDAIAAKPDEHVGAVVAVKVEIAQAGEEDGRGVAVGEAKCTRKVDDKCPAVRVLLPPGASVAKGDTVEVLGVVARGVAVEKAKLTAVEIDASLLVRSK